jgi:hypothetical protein
VGYVESVSVASLVYGNLGFDGHGISISGGCYIFKQFTRTVTTRNQSMRAFSGILNKRIADK